MGFRRGVAVTGDSEVWQLCRLRWTGHHDHWEFAIYLAGRDGYELNILPTGAPPTPTTRSSVRRWQRSSHHDDRSPDALELRTQIGILLLAANRLREAAQILRPLHDDLVATRGPDHPEAREIRDLLTRIRLTGESR